MLPMQGAWIGSLVQELRSHMPPGMAKKITPDGDCSMKLKDACSLEEKL